MSSDKSTCERHCKCCKRKIIDEFDTDTYHIGFKDVKNVTCALPTKLRPEQYLVCNKCLSKDDWQMKIGTMRIEHEIFNLNCELSYIEKKILSMIKTIEIYQKRSLNIDIEIEEWKSLKDNIR